MQAFNTKLKLRFLLDPLDMKPDLTALAARAGTDPGQWDFSRVAGWLGQGEAGPQVAVLQAAAGTGEGQGKVCVLNAMQCQQGRKAVRWCNGVPVNEGPAVRSL